MRANKPLINVDTEEDPVILVKIKRIEEFNKYFN
jgi:hypothetical protein